MENEPSFAHCEKKWVVNRIVDQAHEAKIISNLLKYQQKYIHIPFKMEEYAHCRYDLNGLPGQFYTHSPGKNLLHPSERTRALEYPFRHKNLYVMNNNGARNAALNEGRQLGEWVMPWDGNCFLTQAAWDSILRDMESLLGERYLIVPMTRVLNNHVCLPPDLCRTRSKSPRLFFAMMPGKCSMSRSVMVLTQRLTC